LIDHSLLYQSLDGNFNILIIKVDYRDRHFSWHCHGDDDDDDDDDASR